MTQPNMQLADVELTVTKALPNGAATIYTDGIDLGKSANGLHLAECELEISAPALVVGDLADAATMKYSVEMDTDSAFGSITALFADILTQTGAGGAGAAAATKRVRLPSDVERYIRVKAVNSGAGDASDKSVTAKLLF
jgi:hypothetical protein